MTVALASAGSLVGALVSTLVAFYTIRQRARERATWLVHRERRVEEALDVLNREREGHASPVIEVDLVFPDGTRRVVATTPPGQGPPGEDVLRRVVADLEVAS